MVGDEDHALWKVTFESSVFCLFELSSHALIPTDAHLDWRPPVGHGGGNDAKVLLGHSHPGIEKILAVEVERRADKLGNCNSDAVSVFRAMSSQGCTDAMMLPLKYTANKNMRRACFHAPCFILPPGCSVYSSEGMSFAGPCSDLRTGAEAGWCRCRRLSVVMAMLIGRV
jgi:hypothetical protein